MFDRVSSRVHLFFCVLLFLSFELCFFCCLNWSVWLSEGLNSTFYSLRFWVSTSLRTWTSTFTASVVCSSMESSKCWISASSLTHNIPIVVWRNYTLPPFSIYLHWLVPWLGRNRIKRIFWSRVNRFQVTGKFFLTFLSWLAYSGLIKPDGTNDFCHLSLQKLEVDYVEKVSSISKKKTMS